MLLVSEREIEKAVEVGNNAIAADVLLLQL